MLKIIALAEQSWFHPTVAQDLVISQSEVSQSLNHSKYAEQIADSGKKMNKTAFNEFIFHGVGYAFPKFHSTKDIVLPTKIVLMPIPPFCTELNPAEKVWHCTKVKIAMKVFDILETLKDKINDLINKLERNLIKSITGYDF